MTTPGGVASGLETITATGTDHNGGFGRASTTVQVSAVAVVGLTHYRRGAGLDRAGRASDPRCGRKHGDVDGDGDRSEHAEHRQCLGRLGKHRHTEATVNQTAKQVTASYAYPAGATAGTTTPYTITLTPLDSLGVSGTLVTATVSVSTPAADALHNGRRAATIQSLGRDHGDRLW